MNRYDLVLLGFISERDCSGYDIMTLIRQRELDRWAKISTSTIYNRLNRLERNGFLEGRNEREGNRPERTTYSITEKGRELLKKEVVKHLIGFNDDPRTLGYAFLYATDPIEVARTLEAHARKLQREIEEIDEMVRLEPQPTLYEGGPFLNCMSRDHMTVELKYTLEAVKILRNPAKAEKLKGYFYINFGAREFQK